ncbi:MAG: TIGR04086 family membrane protein [Clostridia bacterium]|nr:TIGR04086 family membrane protein [Clostridia bacterium]
MKMKESVKSGGGNRSSIVSSIAKGSIVALCSSLLLVLVFAFLLKFTNIPDSAITPVNQVIKGVSVFLGVFVGMKKIKELGLISGLLIGVVYTIAAFFVFSILAGGFVFDLTFITDIVFGAIIGGVCGIICVNLKKSSN